MQICLVLIFFSLIIEVDLLSCEDCIAPGDTCHGKIQHCFLGEETCGTFLGEITLGLVGYKGVLKTCTEENACKAGIQTMTIGPGIMFQRNALCCKEDNCNSKPAKLPIANTTWNGHSCPVCYAQDEDLCEVNGTMDCTGSENHCVYITVTLDSLVNNTAISTRFSARGCATKSICDLGKGLSVF